MVDAQKLDSDKSSRFGSVYNSVVSRFTNQPDSVHEFLLRLRNATRRKLWKIGGKRVDNPPPVVVVSGLLRGFRTVVSVDFLCC